MSAANLGGAGREFVAGGPSEPDGRALLTYILLVRACRSLLLPLKTIILNLLSVAATLGAMVLFWQDGHGSKAIFDIEATGAVPYWIPLWVFALLFGPPMDYEVFICPGSGSSSTARDRRTPPSSKASGAPAGS